MEENICPLLWCQKREFSNLPHLSVAAKIILGSPGNDGARQGRVAVAVTTTLGFPLSGLLPGEGIYTDALVIQRASDSWKNLPFGSCCYLVFGKVSRGTNLRTLLGNWLL